MKTSESIVNISAALVAAQADASNATFDSVNPHFRNKYASLAEVITTMKPVLAKHGLSVVQFPEVCDAGSVVLTTRIVHASGEWMESAYPIQPTKNDPQGWGSGITYARRYTLPGVLMIASEEDDDGNAASVSPAPKPSAQPLVKPNADVMAFVDTLRPAVMNAASKDELKAIWDNAKIDKSDLSLYGACLELFNQRLNALRK